MDFSFRVELGSLRGGGVNSLFSPCTHPCVQVFRGLIINPIVNMTLLGILSNFVFQRHLPGSIPYQSYNSANKPVFIVIIILIIKFKYLSILFKVKPIKFPVPFLKYDVIRMCWYDFQIFKEKNQITIEVEIFKSVQSEGRIFKTSFLGSVIRFGFFRIWQSYQQFLIVFYL